MIDLRFIQALVIATKKKNKFPVGDTTYDLKRARDELNEVCKSFAKKDGNLGEEIADVLLFFLSVCDTQHIDLEEEIKRKAIINSTRVWVVKETTLL